MISLTVLNSIDVYKLYIENDLISFYELTEEVAVKNMVQGKIKTFETSYQLNIPFLIAQNQN